MIDRRTLLTASILIAAVGPGVALAAPGTGAALADLEREHGGRLGVAILDGVGPAVAHRGDERFALCSTFKALAAGFVLARVDRGEESLDRRVIYGRDVLLPYAPRTS